MHIILKFYIITKQTLIVVGNSKQEGTGRKEGLVTGQGKYSSSLVDSLEGQTYLLSFSRIVTPNV